MEQKQQETQTLMTALRHTKKKTEEPKIAGLIRRKEQLHLL